MIIAVFCSIVASLVLSYAFFYQRKQISELASKLGELGKSQKQYEMEQSALVHADLIFSKQLNEINRQLISMDNQLQSLENKRQNDGGYQHAIRILEMGGTKEEIMESCHLSNAEAELIMNLNAYQLVLKKQVSSFSD
ncbi:DUF2802 domain-containing protein [Legionella dresdenensis]|uniref:DUF2802 domain-containing protein n=1 Tax=Legionella dresdenensis TaxID=450200 RepID=A0ABV8CCN1_9GAMM